MPVSMSFPPPLSCEFHPYIPISGNCATCSDILANLGIYKQQSGTIIPKNDATTSSVYENAAEGNNASGDRASYPGKFQLWEHDRHDEAHNYHERLALDEHEREDDADDYPERFELEDREKSDKV